MASNLEQRRLISFRTPKSVSVQRLRLRQLDRSQRGGGRGKGFWKWGNPLSMGALLGELGGGLLCQGPWRL